MHTPWIATPAFTQGACPNGKCFPVCVKWAVSYCFPIIRNQNIHHGTTGGGCVGSCGSKVTARIKNAS